MGMTAWEPHATSPDRYHQHDQVPADPSDGDWFGCSCGYSATFVVLDDGLPGEWVD